MGNQSNVIFGYLLAAFIVFITLRGELPLYMGFILGGRPPGQIPDTGTKMGPR